MWHSALTEASRLMAMNTKFRLYQPVAFNLIVAVVIGVCFGAGQGLAQDSVVGKWSPVNSLPFFPVHSHTLPTGKVMIWPGDGGISGNDPRSWDPANENAAVTPLPRPGFDTFCTGHSFLADGRLFVAGGHIQNGVGLKNASIYDPFANAWTPLSDMNAGRWYPTVTVLANGDVLVVSGSIDGTFGNNTVPQVFQLGSGTWRNLAQLGQDLYPMMLLAPNGKVFNAGPTQNTRYLDTASGTWSAVANRAGPYRDYGSAVMYAPGKILVMGGGPPTNTAEVIDLNQASPTWRAVQPMAFARRQLNATLLPDGNVLVTGGTSIGVNEAAGAVYAAELWNPTTEQWTTLASSSGIPRLYHSTAVLLPDGRVLSMGGNDYLQPEIYSPPYLFKGTRPTITSAPASVVYGQSFFVGTPDAAAISKVTMLRLSSVTHAFNMSQHISTLNFSQAAGGLNVVAPAGAAVASPATVAPPGHYLLFILNGSGVPSVGRIVKVGSDPTALTLTTLSPSSAVVGGPDFTLTVNGNNFVSGSVVRWNGANRPTTFVSATRLTAQIPATDIAAGGTASVTVLNPGPGGAVSNALTFTITTLSREVWTGISGTTVASIPVGTTPNITDILPNFEAPEGWADNYGTRLRGYIKAPVTGNYIFWIASDDNSELWLSTINDNPVNKVNIASVPEYTDSRQWDKFPSQKSVAIPLQVNTRYYVEALQKEGGGGDNLAVGWAKPGEATSAPSEVIPGSVLSPFSGGRCWSGDQCPRGTLSPRHRCGGRTLALCSR